MAAVVTSLTSLQLFFVLVAGIIPPLLWLWFWLKEDKKRPEPRTLIVLSFFAGALSILAVIPLEAIAANIWGPGLLLLLVWAAIEEGAKLGVAYLVDFRRRTYDEPVDSMIYLVTVAIGFASFENVLFLLRGLSTGGLQMGIIMALMRFLGATLLHVFSSATLGGIIAMAFCKDARTKHVYALVGLLVSSALHTLFNFFIINQGLAQSVSGNSGGVIAVFAMLWVGIIFLLLFFERVKTVTCPMPPRHKPA